jgi:hypothetical protein
MHILLKIVIQKQSVNDFKLYFEIGNG